MGIASEYLTRLARLYREADRDNAEWDAARRQPVIDEIKRIATEGSTTCSPRTKDFT